MPPIPMLTFAELYCARHGCPSDQFQRRIFWRTLHPHAVLLAPLLLITDHFDSDLELIKGCSHATCLRQINEEIRDHHLHPVYGHWLHQRIRFRVSTRRIRRLAARYFTMPSYMADAVLSGDHYSGPGKHQLPAPQSIISPL